MSRVTRNRAKRQRQRQARKIQAINRRRDQKKKQWKGRKLTAEEKKIRLEKINRRRNEKVKKKKLLTEKNDINILGRALKLCFDKENLDKLSVQTGFIKRTSSVITAFSFVYMISFGFFADGGIALCYLTAGLSSNFQIEVTSQALSKRINRRVSVDFLKSVLSCLMAAQIKFKFENKKNRIFDNFSSVVLEDSTQISLNEHLAPCFEGSGGGASKSSVKLNFIYDIKRFLVLEIKKSSGIVSDKANCNEILKYLLPGMLIVRDLGYFSLDTLKKIQNAKAYFLSRLSSSVNVYLNKNDDKPINISEYLKNALKDKHGLIDTEVYLGKEKEIKVRLVAQSVPEKVINQRIARYKEEYRKAPSESYVAWSGFSIFITNIPREMFLANMIIGVYKLRWQIELIFKNLKSNLDIDILKGTNKHRIECLIYGRLIALVTIFMIHSFSAKVAGAEGAEMSGDKLTKLLKSDSRLQNVVKTGLFTTFLVLLVDDLHFAYKQKRVRKTTMESLEDLLTSNREDIFNNPCYLCA